MLKGTESIIGKMEVYTKVTLSMESVMDMEFGGIRNKFTKEVIEWIRSKGWEYTNG